MSASDHYADYTVVSQSNESRINSAGAVENGWTVTVRDGLTNVTVPVFVPADHYTAANVREAIAAKLATVREVHNLGA